MHTLRDPDEFTTSRRRPRRLAASLVPALAALALLGACSSDGTGLGDGVLGGDESAAPENPETPEPETPEPEPETPEPEPEAPEPEPETPDPQPPTTDQPTDPDGGGDDGTGDDEAGDDDGVNGTLVALLVLGGLAIAAIIIATQVSNRRREQQRADLTVTRQRVGEIIGLGRWIVDQGTVEVLRPTEAQQLQVANASVRNYAIDLEARCSVLAGQPGHPTLSAELQRVAVDSAALRGALDTNVSLRVAQDAASNAALIDETMRTATARRQELHNGIARLTTWRN